MAQRFVVIGLGNFGTGVVESLHQHHQEVAAIDMNGEAVDRVSSLVDRAIQGDGCNIRVLEKLGARGADAAVVSTGDDITASILATMALRDLGLRRIYVKVISREHARVMERIGVEETIFPERESAFRLGTRMLSRGVINYYQISQGFGVQEMAVPENWVGRTLRDLELRTALRISVIAVHDMLKDEVIDIPNPDEPLKESDTLLIAGREKDLERAARV